MGHLKKHKPDRWDRKAEKIKDKNLLFSQAFQTMAKLLRIMKKNLKFGTLQPSTDTLNSTSCFPSQETKLRIYTQST
jgi:hypothetical protein